MSLKYNISYEVASIIFLILLLFYIRLQYDTSSRLNKEFRKLTWIGLIANVLDVATAITISYASVVPIEVNTLLNTLYFMSIAGLGYQVMNYDAYYVYRDKMKCRFVQVNQILTGIYAVILIVNIFAGFFSLLLRTGDM